MARWQMDFKYKHRIIAVFATLIISFIVIYLNLVSHDKTQQIYSKYTQEMIIQFKKEFLQDTVNNMLLEIDELRVKMDKKYDQLTMEKSHRIQEEAGRNQKNFLDFTINLFEKDIDNQLWTVLLWNDQTGEILYNPAQLQTENKEKLLEELKKTFSSYAQIEHQQLRGIFGIHHSYVVQKAKEETASLIRSQKFSNDSYIWVNEIIKYEGGDNYAIRKVHPNLRDTEGMYLSTNRPDISGGFPYKEELEGINTKGETFYTYYFKKLNSDIISKKITYAKLYAPYDWIVAMGVHLDEIDQMNQTLSVQIRESSKKTIFDTLKGIILVLFIGFIIIHRFEQKHLNTDTVTKALSRKYGEKIIQRRFIQHRLFRKRCAIMMFDIDDFKHINDAYGHDVGDIVLREVSKSVARTLSSMDYFIRWGGDEFICVITNMKADELLDFGRKIVDIVSTLPIKIKNETIHISISAGLSMFNLKDDNPNDVIKRTDEALYISKNRGKNCVTIWKSVQKDT